jgi:hypothetical protein
LIRVNFDHTWKEGRLSYNTEGDILCENGKAVVHNVGFCRVVTLHFPDTTSYKGIMRRIRKEYGIGGKCGYEIKNLDIQTETSIEDSIMDKILNK